MYTSDFLLVALSILVRNPVTHILRRCDHVIYCLHWNTSESDRGTISNLTGIAYTIRDGSRQTGQECQPALVMRGGGKIHDQEMGSPINYLESLGNS